MWYKQIVLCIGLVMFLTTCGTAVSTSDSVAEIEERSATATFPPFPTTPAPTATSVPTATPVPTNTATSFPTTVPSDTPTASPTYTATTTASHTPTEIPLPTNTNTPIPPTLTPILETETPLPSPTSSLPGNPISLTGGSYNGCPLLTPGQYTTNPFGCDSCVRMDLANWTMGQPLLQVSGAYEENGDIHIILSNGQDINLHALNYLWLVEIHSVSRAIETWEDSISHVGLDQLQMYSILGPGTTVGYLDNIDYGTKVLKVTAVCGQ